MPDWNYSAAPQAASGLSSYNEARLEAIRKLCSRLETMAGVVVLLAVMITAVAGAITAHSDDGAATAIAAVASGAVTLFFGAFFYSAVRLVCNAILFTCEHMAGL